MNASDLSNKCNTFFRVNLFQNALTRKILIILLLFLGAAIITYPIAVRISRIGSIPISYDPSPVGNTSPVISRRSGTIQSIPSSAHANFTRKSNDVNGNTVIYQGKIGVALNGSGIFPPAGEQLEYHIGSVDSFQTIPQSDDEYLVLNDPETSQFLSRVRIDMSSTYTQTDVRVENLSLPILEGSSDILIEKIGLVNQIGKETLHQLVQKADIVSVIVRPDDEVTPMQNGSKDEFAVRLILRRFGGRTTLEREIQMKL